MHGRWGTPTLFSRNTTSFVLKFCIQHNSEVPSGTRLFSNHQTHGKYRKFAKTCIFELLTSQRCGGTVPPNLKNETKNFRKIFGKFKRNFLNKKSTKVEGNATDRISVEFCTYTNSIWQNIKKKNDRQFPVGMELATFQFINRYALYHWAIPTEVGGRVRAGYELISRALKFPL